MRIAMTLLVTTLTAATARAQAPGETPARPTFEITPKSEEVAVAVTVTGTVLPAALLYGALRAADDPEAEDNDAGLATLAVIGLIFTPGAGHWYARRPGWLGMGTRFLAVPTVIAGLADLDDQERCRTGYFPADSQTCRELVGRTGAWTMIGIGSALYVGSVAYDIWSSRREVRAWNRRYATPTLYPVAGGASVGVAGTF